MNDRGIKEVLSYFPDQLRREVERVIREAGTELNEIRLRIGRPIMLIFRNSFQGLSWDKPVTSELINDVFEKMCDYSVYSRQSELSQGFIMLPGGHRVGVCGTASFDKLGSRTVKYISSLNIRIASEHIGCSEEIFQSLFPEKICGVLIAGPPCSGKTTLLKDFALKLSSPPFCHKTVMVDERNELAAMVRGMPQSTVGDHCDVLTGYPKAEGILNAVRTLSPEIIICDEIGDRDDSEAVCSVINNGTFLISSAHACNVNELYRREPIKKILNTGVFDKIVVLKGGSARCELDCIAEVGINDG